MALGYKNLFGKAIGQDGDYQAQNTAITKMGAREKWFQREDCLLFDVLHGNCQPGIPASEQAPMYLTPLLLKTPIFIIFGVN